MHAMTPGDPPGSSDEAAAESGAEAEAEAEAEAGEAKKQKKQGKRRGSREAQEGQHVALGVVGVDPAEPVRRRVELPQRGVLPVGRVQVAGQPLHALVDVEVQHPPVQPPGVRPLAALAELRPHEQQLLARVGPHVGQQRAQPGEPAPFVAGHLAQQRALPVHHLVVGQRQDEVLGVRVHHRERHLVVVVLPVDRVQRADSSACRASSPGST